MTGSSTLPPLVFHERGSGHPVVLIHPLGADQRYWDFLALPGRHLLTYNLPGHGGTPPAGGPYSIEDLGDQLAAAILARGSGPASIVGVSIGGLIAQHVAMQHPAAVDHLVIADAVSVYPEEVARNLAGRGETVLRDGLSAIVDPTLSLWFSQDFTAADGPAVSLTRSMVLGSSPRGYADACSALVAVDLSSRVASIEAPTLVMCGRDDLPAFVNAAPVLASTIRDARLCWIEGGRHAAVLECSDQSQRELDSFLPRAGA